LTVSTVVGGSQQLVANTGRFYPTDVGKPITIAASGTSSWTNMFGYITQYVDSTHVRYQPAAGQTPSTIAAKVATIGANEPDANYVVAGFCGDTVTPESYSVTNITTTGFTLRSSNATSTANVVALIVR
jgi:hypothetical protein